MYRFLARPKWILFTLLIVVLVVTMVNLAFWQLRRLDQRQRFNAQVRHRIQEQPAPLDQVLAAYPVAGDAQWRSVTVTGVYEPQGQVLIRDRSLDGVAGFDVVTPLRLADGRFLVVNRGFLPAATATPPPPSGTVSLVGRLRTSQRKRHSWEKADPATGVLDKLNRVDVPRIDQQVDGTAVPMYVEAISSDPADDSVTQLPLPELTEGPHLSYAVQWFLFSAAAIVGWVLAVRKSASDRRKAAAKAAKAAAAAAAVTAEGAPADAAPVEG